jgi:hypothetical protein
LSLDGDIEITRAQNRNYAFADGFRRLARKDNTFPLFLRTVEEFERLKALRPESPKEAILEVQSEENEPPPTRPRNPFQTRNRTRSPPWKTSVARTILSSAG